MNKNFLISQERMPEDSTDNSKDLMLNAELRKKQSDAQVRLARLATMMNRQKKGCSLI